MYVSYFVLLYYINLYGNMQVTVVTNKNIGRQITEVVITVLDSIE
jgi:hypothetical protein